MDTKCEDSIVEEQSLQLKKPSNSKPRNPRETRVLLVTIQNSTNCRTLQHSEIYAAFSKYGEVQRILIFKTTDPQATFVEMDSIESARAARKHLNNTQILSDGTRINVLVSNKQRIDFQDKNPAGIDYTILKQRIIEKQINFETEMIVNSIFEEKIDQGDPRDRDVQINDNLKQSGIVTNSSNSNISDGNACSGVSTGSGNSNALSQHQQHNQPQQQQCQKISHSNQQSSPSNNFPYPQQPLFPLISPGQLLNNSNLTQVSDSSNQSTRQNYQNQGFSQENMYSSQQKYQQKQFQQLHQQPQLQKQHQMVHSWNNQKDQLKSTSSNSSSTSSAASQKLKGISSFLHGSGNEADEEFKTDDSNSLHNNNQNRNNNSLNRDSHNASQSYESLLNSFEELNLEQSIYSKVDRSIDIKQSLPFQTQTLQQQSLPCFQDQSMHQQNLISFQTAPLFISESSNTFFSSLPNPTTLIQRQLASSAPNNLQLFQQQKLQQSNDDVDYEIYSNVDEKTTPLDFFHPQFAKVTKKSKVIYANRFEPTKTTLIQIFNLFSAFGNIHKIIFLRAKSAVLIEYDNEHHACLAKDYLNDHLFNGNILKIYYSHHEGIFFNDGAEKPSDEDYFEVSEKMHRFKSDTITPINPPIDTLHISNIRRDSCSFDVIKKLFDPFAKIKNFKLILEQNNKNMCLLKFENASIAMWALANTHGVMLNNSQRYRFQRRHQNEVEILRIDSLQGASKSLNQIVRNQNVINPLKRKKYYYVNRDSQSEIDYSKVSST